jgi:hypothetical protein
MFKTQIGLDNFSVMPLPQATSAGLINRPAVQTQLSETGLDSRYPLSLPLLSTVAAPAIMKSRPV